MLIIGTLDMGRPIRLLLLAITLLVASIVSPARASDSRGVDLADYRGGLLIRNGQQTSCEVALIDGTSAFIAATCVTDGNGNIDTSASYQIYVDSRIDKLGARAPLLSSAITVHPRFDPSTFANNIAIIRYSLEPSKQWHINVAIARSEWEGSVYMRRRMNNMDKMDWASTSTGRKDMSDADCAKSYGLYGANNDDFKCTSDTAPRMMDSACGVPYGTYYSIMQDRAYLAGIYSHSVIDGDTLCSSKNAVHYYTLVSNYIAFAQKVLGRGVATMSTSNATPNSDSSYRMAAGSFFTPDGMRAFAGNEFAKGDDGTWQTANGPGDPSPLTAADQQQDNNDENKDDDNAATQTGITTSRSTSASRGRSSRTRTVSATGTLTDQDGADGPDATDAASAAADWIPHESQASALGNGVTGVNDSPGGDGHSKGRGGLTKGQVAAIVVCLVLFAIFATVGAFYGLRWYRRRKLSRWSPSAVQQILESHMVENEVGSAPHAKFELPSYRHHRDTALVAAGPH
ncbi:hypothetical protein LPJ61_004924 [Coemansia biformis]|uniref:Peptidase S1 domain-containing protein n=1 Tax=Coemansia biformis TaxID=1286918 RepID=A0A9W8CUW3_9FUNG|nr:hypothetical protein LPJ61_004924 [Coemansia biformis]